ncbi:alkaline phosphatase family protein [Mycobacterium shinjukuense]|uniref:Alkaline phosphatase family protein n=1 Tax=Mycobacterium shinjukuense TaxID=398694 RepID=A0A7I7MMT5_9MYCO|nr:nucleotide pyrophosphatase/phosphodiesterase family protein [Mycobacterium shinjukuense]MCV6986974.1 alkaline phosphatase family protein [Mycobacterium shinjukuense]ORB71132.1 alkaline phosphatase family protein [Mycobacterium shinjukuense]BBX73581.1 alkaline phosphatase family protein [Mycobacterium shinjukuense]
MTHRVLLIDVVGLTRPLLRHMPNLSALAAQGALTQLAPVFPAVTCPVQSSMVTGLMPNQHGIVGNGWYFRDLGEVLLWRQSNKLVAGEKVWETAAGRFDGYRSANVGWWYAMNASNDVIVTPRPVYHQDGRKSPDCYTVPADLHDILTEKLGTFPLFQYWGPTANITSSRWLVDASIEILQRYSPTLLTTYIPHLDYDFQRYGPHSPLAITAATDVDAALGPLLTCAAEHEMTTIVVSEYGIASADTPVDINRLLRRESYLNVYTQQGREYLDPWTSRAFAVADHQVAHVYVRDDTDIARVASLLTGLHGVDEVLDRNKQRTLAIDHPRSGELVAIAKPGAWFTYYYWLDDDRAPEFAPCVDIHRKPGYDPAELLMNPGDRAVKVKAAAALVKKAVGLRYTMGVVALNGASVGGTHGRLPDSEEDAPVVITSSPELLSDAPARMPVTDVRDLVLDAHARKR